MKTLMGQLCERDGQQDGREKERENILTISALTKVKREKST